MALTLAALLVPPAGALDVSALTDLEGRKLAEDTVPSDVILVFFSSWSPRCRYIVERVEKIHADWGDQASVFLVNFQEDRSAVDRFIKGKDLNVQILLDAEGAFSKKHTITALPSLLAIKDDTLAYRGRLTRDPAALLRPIFDPTFQ